MSEAKLSDSSQKPLLAKTQNDGDSSGDEFNAFVTGKWNKHGILRANRNSEGATTLSSIVSPFRLITYNRRRLFILTALIAILFLINSASMSRNDSQTSNQITVNHRSHVPGMKDDDYAFTFVPLNATSQLVSTRSSPEKSTAASGIDTSETSNITELSSTTEISSTTDNLFSTPPIQPFDNCTEPKKGFLVWTHECQIPDLDPFAPQIRMSFKKVKPPKCLRNPLTTITQGNSIGNSVLNFHENLRKNYGGGKLECCFSEIKRSSSWSSYDNKVEYSKCINFNKSIDLSSELGPILVTCRNDKKKVVYTNVHILVPRKKTIEKRLKEWEKKGENLTQPMSVVLFGIDSVSRMNLLRVMPKTAKYLQSSGWIEMAGYNKVADNTYPNLMSILTGYNKTSAYALCKPKKVGGLDACPFIWSDFQKSGYITGYAEDTQGISTFNYLKLGFKNEPTDFYLRPAVIAAEQKLTLKRLSGLNFCLGFKSSLEYVYDYIQEIKNTYKNESLFGLFWTNSGSHNAFDTASAIDETIVEYFNKFNSSGLLNDTIIVLFSDHGMRFGKLRLSPTGHLEERLPFFYIWVPQKFRDQYPGFVKALQINKHRLTTPFDLHMTLWHILELSGRVKNIRNVPGCPKCQSLFVPIPESRSCEDVAVEDHWCTCRAFHNVDKQSAKIQTVTHRTIDYINDLVAHANNGSVAHLCKHLKLKKIVYANLEVLPHEPANSTLEGYQLSFITDPGGAMFETTVRFDTKTKDFTVTGTISRLNSYSKQAHCVHLEAVKKFCAC